MLVLDDDADARAWLQAAVRQAFPDAEVTAAGSLREARVALRAASPDLALIDLDLPDGSGVSLIEVLARPPHRTISVVSTVFADDQHLFPALRAGAAGYLLKDDAIERLAELLLHTAQGKPPLSASIAARLLGYFHAPEAPATSLTQREQEVLTLLAKGLTIGDVAQALEITTNTAASYTKSLYRKLDVTNRAEATLEATRRGLIRL
ncbi:MAG: response regulator transcription factor [Burkholderiales bacterium]|nr:response regulator transcription factor [Burkholderiales bacterium]